MELGMNVMLLLNPSYNSIAVAAEFVFVKDRHTTVAAG
jgi:hypothetical protein